MVIRGEGASVLHLRVREGGERDGGGGAPEGRHLLHCVRCHSFWAAMLARALDPVEGSDRGWKAFSIDHGLQQAAVGMEWLIEGSRANLIRAEGASALIWS